MSNRNRISIPKEDRIWDLRSQGYDYDSIARITNVSSGCLSNVIRRIIHRPPMHKDPIKRGRGHSFLSDSQIHQIRQRRQMGQTYLQIAKAFGMHETAIGKICRGETYSTPCNDDTISGYKFDFGNRLTRAA